MLDLRRREFITLLGGAAAGWPFVVRAQQLAMPVIGLLLPGSPATFTAYLDAYRKGLNETGHVEGRNVTIEYRWLDGQYERVPGLVADLVQRRVAVIAAPGSAPAALAAKAATAIIPIVFAVGEDPVRLGLVESLARPGGNATGINFFVTEVVGKRLELLHELVPAATRVAVLVNPANASTSEATSRDAEAAARARGLDIFILKASSTREIDAAFATITRERAEALFVGPDGFFNSRRVQFAVLAARDRIPACYASRAYVEAGGLMSYGTNATDRYQQAGIYTGRILKGEKPADIPVVQSTKFEFVINLQTAIALGIDVPAPFMLRADEVIE